ncbi:hypothetical protein [Streptomyces griseocarneus]|uniref:hypothetical protein n=1 Tax=Streptomyces griseocarneus TaxID=51201 RepID=UPI00167C6E7D|nr:hypothetical protein [Streptomyces griseocarneus]MBZ6477515.1 hypothetical protein [Streptomyces griseocarneus]
MTPPEGCCWLCARRRPLFLATEETHDLEDRAWLCVRCWSRFHLDALDVCFHCGSRLVCDGPIAGEDDLLW